MRLLSFAVALAGVVAVAVAPASAASYADNAAPHSLYAQSTATVTTSSTSWTPIAGMQFTLPPARPGARFALVTLNLPNTAGLSSGATCSYAIFAGSTELGVATGLELESTTVVSKVALTSSSQTIAGEFELAGSFGSQAGCEVKTYYSLSAILTQD